MLAQLAHIRRFLGLAAFVSVAAAAAPPTFQITELFSNLDGSVQFIRLTETAGLDGQNNFAGLILTSSHNGVEKTFKFQADLPTQQTAHRSIVVVAIEGTLLVPVNFGERIWFCCYRADFYMPPRFLATDGGTLDFAGVDRMTYASLPTDGARGLFRDGTVARATLPDHSCTIPPGCPSPTAIAQTPVAAIEYYHAGLAHYFITASAPDIDAIDSARVSGWQRTGFTFPVASTPGVLPGTFPSESGPSQAVCRFYLPPEDGDSHFLSASPEECAEVRARYPTFVLESDAAFYAALPNPLTGECPPPYGDLNDNTFTWLPVFRLWNRLPDTNHRYTINLFVRNAMIDSGYVSEGYGPAGVAFCVPQKNLE